MRSTQLKIVLLGICLIFTNTLKLGYVSHNTLKNDDMEAFREAELSKHNQLRRLHGVPQLQLDQELNQSAQRWAQHLAEIGQMVHSEGQYGQNLYYMWSSPPMDYQNGDATQSWYDEIEFYDFENPDFSSQTGHFTQVIWKGSERVGFGFASNSDGKDFVVAQYDPPGNFLGQFAQNVLPA